jgi:hypothetical protein
VASRCWVCHRSSTSCGTCLHFRGSVAARVGFCGLDRRREPLAGDEVRACWVDGALPAAPDPATPGLLDLLTVAALRPDDPADADAQRGDGPSAPRADAARDHRSRRLWVEVEAQPAEAQPVEA